MVTKKEKVEVIDAEILEELVEPNWDFDEHSRKKPRGKRKKDFPMFKENVKNRILTTVMTGAPLDVAADAAGVSLSTVQDWLSRGEMAQEQRELDEENELAPIEHDFADFYIAYKKSTSFGVVKLTKLISEACEDDPKLAMRWLEKIKPEYFGPKQQIHMTGQMVQGHIHVSGNKLPGGEDLTRRLSTGDLKLLRSDLVKKKQKQLEAGEIEEDAEI